MIDFSKAFDKVSQEWLLYELDCSGIHPQTSVWVTSFLSSRMQKIVIDGKESYAVSVTSGVPQGSVLVPILFLVYIVDMPKYLSTLGLDYICRWHNNVSNSVDDC